MDSNFRGRFEIKVDVKGRLSLPPAFRSPLMQNIQAATPESSCHLVITNSQYMGQSCLHGYSLEEWQKLERKIAKLSPLKAEVQAFQRFYLSGGQVVEVDAQNRVLVPVGLRKYAGLEGQAVLVGMGNKFEIWSQDRWETVYGRLASSFEETMSAVAALEMEDGE